jgi:tetratricopeptide (TPR) repeat protein
LAEDHHATPLLIARLLSELAALSHAERLRAVEGERRFHSRDLCRLLLEESRKAAFLDGSLGVDWASLAVRVAGHLGPEPGAASTAALPTEKLAAVRAEALATLGNAYRVIGELRAAEECFLSAEQLLALPGVTTPALLGEVRSLAASLRLAQRRLPEAREQVRFALAAAADAGDRHQAGKLLLQEAKIVEEEGDLAAAAGLLRDAAAAIDPEAEPELYRIARFNLLGVLLRQGRHDEAEALFPAVAPLFAGEPAESTHRLRLRWSEGLIARGFHRLDEAEEALLEVQRELVRRQMGYDAALVAIDLGMIYLETGAAKPLRRLAADLLPVFAAKDLSKEAFACLLLYQDACKSARLTSRLARELALFMREDRQRPPSLKVAFHDTVE